MNLGAEETSTGSEDISQETTTQEVTDTETQETETQETSQETSSEPPRDENGEIIINPPWEKEETDGTDDDETTEEEEVETEEDSTETEESEEEKSVDWQKRYSDLLSHTDKTIKKELDQYKRLVEPFKDQIVETDTGLNWNFSEKKETPEKQEEKVPPLPTEDDWYEDPAKATEMLVTHKMFFSEKERQKQAAEERAKEEQTQQVKVFEETRSKVWKETVEKYPQLKDENSDLFQRADDILKRDPLLANSPHCDAYAVTQAAFELGIQPGSKQEKTAPKKNPKKSYILNRKASSGKESNSKMTQEDFKKLPEEKKVELMRKSFFKEE